IAGIPTAGQVPDKYSMNLSGDVFSAVSQSYQYGTGVGGTILNPVGLSAQPAKDYWDGGWITTLETFSLANPSSPAPLGSLQVANGELLDATRFDGTRAYIATSQEWDPLWVVDLSDPANPVTAGSVDVPGWSTYILPMGDELLTLGTVTDRVAVSLFDVHAAANPILQSQVLLGQNYSWSDAAYDDKALTVLSGLGLILVPYEGDTTNGWSDDVQLIDLGQGTLTARGMIQHRFAPLRSLAHNGRIISVSNEELLSVDISDRDNPQVDADVEIAWPVNQLYLQGGFLVEIANGGGWFGADPPAVRVALAQSPDAVAARLDLDDVPVVGSTLQNGLLYLLQSPATAYWGPIPLTASTLSGFSMITDTNLLLTVVDVSALPALSIVGQTVASPPTSNLGGGNYQPVWPSPGLLVWFNTGFGFWINPLVDSGATGVLPLAGTTVALPTLALGHAAPISLTPTLPAGAPTVLASAGSGAALGPLSLQLGLPRSKALAAQPAMPALQAFLRLPYWRPWWSSGGATLLAFDVSNPAGPGLVSTFDFSPTNGWGFSAPLAAQGLVYFSYEQPQTTWPVTVWRASDSLEVVDYTDPANPTLRPGVNVPGQLAGLSPDGSMLYLLGNAISTFGGFFPTSPQGLNACAYDGVSAYLVASLQLPQSWPQPLIISSNMVYLGRADATGGSNNTLEAWALSSQGQFKRQALAKVAQPLSALAAFGSLLAAQDENNNVSLFDASLPTALIGCGQGGAPGCLWFDLNRAAGALGEGLWLSLDDYGVAAVPYVAPAANARK
ncbi:MAG TPA: beta-propeller domain-containing protein, partial [Candidatus Acidoferrum sp.]|nr:beta-propeller domain-containing protein [Candidatus Acidoferrum sp.]